MRKAGQHPYPCSEEKEAVETTVSMLRRISAVRLFRLAYPAGLALLMTGLLAIPGCSSGNSAIKPQVGAITFTDVNGTPLQTPPTALTVGQNAYFTVNLTHDTALLGADWGVYCGSELPPGTPLPPGQPQDDSCGTFTPAHTMSGPIPSYVTSGSGYVTLYNAPAAPPKQGVVTLYAYATSNRSQFSSITLTINALPISIQFAPAPPDTLATGASAQFKAVLSNDPANAGVNWSVICPASDCGSFQPVKTASGIATTYTAPASIPTGGSVQVTATSVTDPTRAVTATVQIEQGDAGGGMVAGRVQAAQQPVADAQVVLYAATTSATAQGGATDLGDVSVITSATTDWDGNFSLSGYECPAPDAQMYLAASGGNAGGGRNPDLALMTALGPCASLSSHFTIDEATTVAAVYALSGFFPDQQFDQQRIGSSQASPAAVASAFATAQGMVDIKTGLVRTHTLSGVGVIPQATLNTLANVLSACARTAGSAPGDGSYCDQLFRATATDANPSARPKNTVQALLNLTRNATGFSANPDSFASLWQLAESDESHQPALTAQPGDWILSIEFPNGQGSSGSISEAVSAADSAGKVSPLIDAAGNVWVRSDGNALVEYVGGASCPGIAKGIPAAPRSGTP